MRVENSGGIQASLAGRYALALFEPARAGKQLDSVAQSLASVKAALAQSEEFRALTTRPLVGLTAAAATITAVSATLGLDPLHPAVLALLRMGSTSCRDRGCHAGEIWVVG